MARDVTIRGAGVFGLACGWEMARRGAKVRVIDPGGPGAGASGGIVGALAPHTPENWNAKKSFQLESLLAAGQFWGEAEAAGGGCSGFGRLGRLQPVADEAGLALARERATSAAKLWQGRALWEVVPAEGEWVPLSSSGWMIRDTLSGRIQPKAACETLAAAIIAKGGEIEAEAPLEGVVLDATGAAGLKALSEGRQRSVGAGIKGQAALFALDRRDAPQLFSDALHIVPHADGTIAVGSTTEREYASATRTDARLDQIIDRARRVCPPIAKAEVIQRWAGLRPRARSRAPVLGPWPERPGWFVANGGFKIGFGMAPGVARVMADLILDGRDTIPNGFRVEDSL